MTEPITIGIVLVVVLGIGAQWLAWQIRVPSILFLLIVGFLAAPVLGILPPESLQGDWVLAEAAMKSLAEGAEALPDSLTADGPSVDVLPMLANRATALSETSQSGQDGQNKQLTVVLPVLHGPMGEDGTVQGLFELAGVREGARAVFKC